MQDPGPAESVLCCSAAQSTDLLVVLRRQDLLQLLLPSGDPVLHFVGLLVGLPDALGKEGLAGSIGYPEGIGSLEGWFNSQTGWQCALVPAPHGEDVVVVKPSTFVHVFLELSDECLCRWSVAFS